MAWVQDRRRLHLLMAEEPPVARRGPARRSIGRRLLRSLVWALVALLLVVAGLVFVASRTITLQWAAQKAMVLTDGRLTIEGVFGSVLSEISAESVRWHDGGIDVTITSARFTYHPFALLDGLVRIERISAANVEVQLPPKVASRPPGRPIRLPPAMAVMLPMAIERVDVGRLLVRRAGSEIAKLHNIEAVFRHDGDRFNASILNVDVIAGDHKIGLRGEAAVLARAPYASDGRLAVQVPLQSRPLRVDVRLNGPLEELSVRASTVVAGAPVEARTILYALDPRPLRQVRLDLKDLDLSKFDPALPSSRLTASYDAEIMPAWASERKPLLIGPLKLTNTLSGPVDRKRIPVAEATAVVGYVEGRVEVQSLQASGPLGEVTGDGWAGPDSFRVALASDKLRLQGINSALAPRTLKAQVAVEPIKIVAKASIPGAAAGSASGLQVDLKASDSSLAAEMKAVFANSQLQISRAQVQLKPGRKAGGAGQASFSGSVGVKAPWPIELAGDFHDFDPGQLLTMPPALLNGKWRVAGWVAGGSGGQVKTDITFVDSRFRGLPLEGTLAATFSLQDNQPQRLSAVSAGLKWGSNTIDVSGALGEAADVLRLSLDLPKIAEVQEGVAGVIRAQGTLRGSLTAPAVQASIDGRQLTATTGGLRGSIAAARLDVRSERLQSGVLKLRADLSGVDLVRPPGAADGSKGAAGQRIRQGTSRAGTGSEATRRVHFDRMTALVDGSYGDHTAHVSASGSDQRLILAARGGLDDDGRWRGTVHEVAASHPLLQMPVAGGSLPAALPAPGAHDFQSLQSFALTVGTEQVSARDARFDFQGATLNLKQVDWHDSILILKADATGLAARWLGRFIDLEALYGNASRAATNSPQDLRLGAAIDFTGNLADSSASGWRGTMVLKREAGDVSLAGVSLAGVSSELPVTAGLRTLEASATINARVVKVVLNVDGENIGRISGEAQTILQGIGKPVWASSALSRSLLGGRLDLAMNSFRWISPLVDDGWRIDGALSARLQLAGTLTRPRADGVVTGSNLSAQDQALGMRLRDGMLAAEFSGDRIDVKVLRFESGEGSVAISGLLRAPGTGRSEARIVIDRLPIPLGAGQRVVLSGSTTATLEDQTLGVTGRLVADEGVIELKGGDAPAVFSDVAFIDASSRAYPVRKGPPEAAPPPADRPAIRKTATKAGNGGLTQRNPQSFRISTDIEVDLGRHFRVFGSGLQANLNGAIRLRGNFPDAPRATGTVAIVNGTYQICGRSLKIRRGRVFFNGPLENPTLDIVATHEDLKIEPGVKISGTAVSPVVNLTSEPEVADAEKLSWLVLGTGLDDAREAGQLLALQAGATAMFGDGDFKYMPGLTGKLGSDTLPGREDVIGTGTASAGGSSDNPSGAVMTIGRQLSSGLFVTYEQSLRGVWNILKLQYEITDRLSLSVRAGSDSAADLLWFFPFD